MITKDLWSRIIESSHSLGCGLFSLLSILFLINGNNLKYLLCMGVGMGSQLMNSILYMSEYFIQIRNKDNINYNNENFPCGFFLIKRPFMYVNLLWTIFPFYIILYSLFL